MRNPDYVHHIWTLFADRWTIINTCCYNICRTGKYKIRKSEDIKDDEEVWNEKCSRWEVYICGNMGTHEKKNAETIK